MGKVEARIERIVVLHLNKTRRLESSRQESRLIREKQPWFFEMVAATAGASKSESTKSTFSVMLSQGVK